MKQTIENLTKAFIGESQARNRYGIYAKIAKKEGFEQISAIFSETAEQEREHAKQLFKILNKIKADNNVVLVEAEAPLVWGTTIENLQASISGEKHEYESMYPEFAKTAEEEGSSEIAERLRAIGIAEKHHEERFKQLLKELENGTVFKKDRTVDWVCRKCGYAHTGNIPPEVCPSCSHPTSYFQIRAENY